MNIEKLDVGNTTVYVRYLTWREQKQLYALTEENKTDWLLKKLVVNNQGGQVTDEEIDNLSMDVVQAILDFYLNLKKKND